MITDGDLFGAEGCSRLRSETMDYGAILQRAWEIVWNNKFLILLGVLVAFSTGGGSSGNFGGGSGGGDGGEPPFDGTEPGIEEDFGDLTEEDIERMVKDRKSTRLNSSH